MATKQVTVTVSEKLYDAGQALAKLIHAAEAAAKAGWTQGQALPALLSEAVQDAAPIIAGVSAAAAEVGENHSAAANALALGLTAALMPTTGA